MYICRSLVDVQKDMIYIFTLVLLLLMLQLYFPFARKRNMLAGVNHRSSHTKPVITGAGFIFFVSYVIYGVVLFYQSSDNFPWYFFIGLSMLSVVSFIDDLEEVWFLWRLLIQLVAMSLLLWQIQIDEPSLALMPSVVQWSAIVMCWGFSVGLLNMYNFMDGLNGMLGGLVLSTLIPLYLINEYVSPFVDSQLIYFTLIPTLLFLFYNARKQAICFSGDVGAIAVGYVMVYLLIKLMINTGNVAYLAIFSSVFIEAGLTIVQRLFAGENIFQPHRIHLFQLMCNEGKRNHVAVSALYAGVQLFFGLLLFALNYYGVSTWIQNLIVWPLVAALGIIYLLYKRKCLGGHLLGYRNK